MCEQENRSQRLLLAVDGGGTKAEFVLFAADGRIRKRFCLSGTNVSVYGFEQVVQTLLQGIALCAGEQGKLTDLYIGTAGSCLDALQEALSAQYPELHITVESDGMNALHLEEAEAALICGTGSILILKEDDGIRRVGGWGYRMGDPGSGYNFGHKLLQLCAEHEDGICDHQQLFEAVCKKLQRATIRGVLRDLEPPQVAALAPILLEAYEADADVPPVVLGEMAQLAKMIQATCFPGSRVILCGGMFRHYARLLLPILQGCTKAEITYLLPDLPPSYGACVRCCKLAGISCPTEQLKKEIKI